MRRYGLAVGLLIGLGTALWLAAYWQPKKYDGTPLGLYIAPGDTAVVGYVDADTARADTLYGLRAHILHLWVDTLDGFTHLHIDTLSVDSLTAAVAHFDHADADTLDADSLHAIHLAGATAELDVAYIDYLGSVDQHVLRAYIDSLIAGHVGADTIDATIIMGDSLYGDGSHLTGVAGTIDHGELDSLSLLDDDHPQYLTRADFPDSFATAWPDSFTAAMSGPIAAAIHDSLAGFTPPAGIAVYHRIEQASQTSPPNSRTVSGIAGNGSYLVASTSKGLLSYTIDNDGVMTLQDSVRTTIAFGDVKCGGGYFFATGSDSLMAYSVGVGGAFTRTDAELWANGYALDATSEFVVATNGASNRVASYLHDGSGALTYVETETFGVTQQTWDVRIDSTLDLIYVAHDDSGVRCATIDAGGNMTTKDTDTGGGTATHGVWFDANYIYATDYDLHTVAVFTRTAGGALTYKGRTSASTTGARRLWGDGEFLFAAMRSVMLVLLPENDGIVTVVSEIASTGEAYGIWCDGNFIYLSDQAGGVRVFRVTTGGMTFEGPVIVDGDTLWVIDGAAYSYTVAGADWVTSSTRKLKDTGLPFTRQQARGVLASLARLPIQQWRWKAGDTTQQHVGPVAEDWYPIAHQLAPAAADSGEIAGEHQTAALLVAVGELERQRRDQQWQIRVLWALIVAAAAVGAYRLRRR